MQRREHPQMRLKKTEDFPGKKHFQMRAHRKISYESTGNLPTNAIQICVLKVAFFKAARRSRAGKVTVSKFEHKYKYYLQPNNKFYVAQIWRGRIKGLTKLK